MTKTIVIAPVRKSLVIEASQAHAFDVFTAGLDRWWPKEHHIGEAPVVKAMIEPWKGGRWFTLHADGKEVATGHLLVWDAPSRIVFTWEINGQWKPETNPKFASEVDVRFIAEGPNRTRVELDHYNFERMHDVEGAKGMRNDVDNGWPGILEGYKKTAQSG